MNKISNTYSSAIRISIFLFISKFVFRFCFYLNKKYTDQIQDNRERKKRKNNQEKTKEKDFYVAFARVAARLPT